MSNAGPDGENGPQDTARPTAPEGARLDDEVRREWEREIRAWLSLDCAGRPAPRAEEPVPAALPGAAAPGARWSSLLAAYIDSLSRSALQESEDIRGHVLLRSLDEGPPGPGRR